MFEAPFHALVENDADLAAVAARDRAVDLCGLEQVLPEHIMVATFFGEQLAPGELPAGLPPFQYGCLGLACACLGVRFPLATVPQAVEFIEYFSIEKFDRRPHPGVFVESQRRTARHRENFYGVDVDEQ